MESSSAKINSVTFEVMLSTHYSRGHLKGDEGEREARTRTQPTHNNTGKGESSHGSQITVSLRTEKIKTSLQVVSCGLTSFDKLMNHHTEAAAEVHRVLILCLHILGLFISHLTKNHLITISSPPQDTWRLAVFIDIFRFWEEFFTDILILCKS